ncbi:GNAT family N-acetyltransferase [Saccharopolyspora rosea]|uniref:GNAT family N-acetyltransferase n=1 Tax=Saccharopolyspora rosea TaxID=524884 RepID=A0ABW3FVJ7_9PSEU|nr:GNAT family N-acetyltransferase [Saccharopolyspora rosea]
MATGERRQRHGWTRELVELAVLVLAAGTLHLFVPATRGPDAVSPVLLALGASLLVAAAANTRRRRRRVVPASPAPEVDGVAEQRRRLWRLRISLADTPGRLARLAAELAALGGDIRTMQVHPMPDGVVDEVLMHAPEAVREADLVRAARRAGAREVRALRADVRELDDVPTRTIGLAADLLTGRTELVRALRGLIGHVEVRWQEERADDALAEGTMCLSDPGGGVLVLRRPGASFTPAEYARARALAEFAAGCRARSRPDPRRVAVAGGEVAVRPADRDDAELVAEFHARCSAASRYRRYFSPGPQGERGVLRLLTPALGRTLLALGPDGDVVGMGNLMYDGDSAELALLVRDDRQRRGIGSALARGLVGQAAELGVTTLTAHTHVDNIAVARTLRGAGLKLVGAPEPGEWSWARDLRSTPVAAG